MAKSFGAESTTDEVLAGVDLRGKRILVTGASAGLGVETARALAACGATVVGAARDLDKARQATESVRAAAKNGGGLELVRLDLASLPSVRACADGLIAAGKPFDVIIANAGVMACPKGATADGFETQFGTNHLGHFVFINRLTSLLSRGSRIVNLSSAGHRFADVDLDDPGFERTEYQPFVAYGRSKTANVLFSVALDARLKDKGVRATAVHPGDPSGNPETTPLGSEIAGPPTRFAGTVNTSERYICSGSALRSPKRKGGVGEVGSAITSHAVSAESKSPRNSVRTFCARR